MVCSHQSCSRFPPFRRANGWQFLIGQTLFNLGNERADPMVGDCKGQSCDNPSAVFWMKFFRGNIGRIAIKRPRSLDCGFSPGFFVRVSRIHKAMPICSYPRVQYYLTPGMHRLTAVCRHGTMRASRYASSAWPFSLAFESIRVVLFSVGLERRTVSTLSSSWSGRLANFSQGYVPQHGSLESAILLLPSSVSGLQEPYEPGANYSNPVGHYGGGLHYSDVAPKDRISFNKVFFLVLFQAPCKEF